MKCFYHSADFDGHCSGAIVKKAWPDCEMIGYDYGEPFPWDSIVPDEIVFMVDVSLQPFTEMERLADLTQLCWIDHHKAVIQTAKDRNFKCKGTRIVGDAACELSWNYFYSEIPIPLSVRLLGRYDVWDHTDYRVFPFQYGMRTFNDIKPDNQLFWELFFSLLTDDSISEIIKSGYIIIDYTKSVNAKYAKALAFDVELDGYNCIAMNIGFGNSQMFDAVWDVERYDVMIAFCYTGKFWKVSLYSDKAAVDVSEIAKGRGGGGHAGAAGFQCETLPWNM